MPFRESVRLPLPVAGLERRLILSEDTGNNVVSAQDAVEKMEAGASIVQLYTGFIYKGPELIADCSEAIAQWRDQHGR